jgi:AbrB family looped-hinge helix DNA binding protein
MEEIANVDKQGRVVLPSKIREALGMKDGGEVMIRFNGERVVIEPASVDSNRRAREWGRKARALRTEAFSADASEARGEGEREKWVSGEYARRKLGLD